MEGDSSFIPTSLVKGGYKRFDSRVGNIVTGTKLIFKQGQKTMSELELLEKQTDGTAEEQKERHYAEAGKAVRQLSHAIKNIMQMVGGAAEVIDCALERNQMDRVIKSWSILSLNWKRLKKYLLDIMDYTKQQSPQVAACDIHEEIKRVLGSLKWIAAQKKFKLQVQLDSAMPQVQADAERIGLMVLNMLLNGIDQSGDEAAVQLQTRFDAAQNQFEIRVIDNGPAYPQEFQQQLFTAHETHKQRFSNGIGIMLAELIAGQHGGRMALDCRDGANTLTATLPVNAGG
jgi:nitrogen-specific signal transduction histidine kinase